MNNRPDLTRQYISSEVRFYTVKDVVGLTGWSEKVVLKMFGDPAFPSADFGKSKLVEAHALIEYFSRKRQKRSEKYWVKGDRLDALRRQAR